MLSQVQKKLKKIVSEKKYFLLDLDGTLYKSSKLFPFSLSFLEALKNAGKKPIFLTNNSSHTTAECVLNLNKMGLHVAAEEIYSSGKATLEYLVHRQIKKIFLLGTSAVHQEFNQAGMITLDNQTTNLTLPDAVVLTFDTTFTYEKFCEAHALIMAGVPFYATHPDRLIPVENNLFKPDIGTLIAAFKTSTGKSPIIIGKPNQTIYRQLQNKLQCQKKEMIAFGDRLYTDIEGANKYGITSVLVLTGEAHKKDLRNSTIKPDFVLEDLGELIEVLK